MNIGVRGNERVVVVGGGPAGLHAAALLRERGVAKVQVLERRDRIGGKVLTLGHAGQQFEMGACFLHRGYAEVEALLRQVGLRPPVAIERRGVTLSGQHVRSRALDLARLLDAARRYRQAHRALLGPPDRGLYGRPRPQALETLAMPTSAWLRDQGLERLEPVFQRACTGQGYGYTEQTPLLYAMLWMTPGFVADLVVSALTRPLQDRSRTLRGRLANTRILPDGFGALCSQMVDHFDLDVELSAEVVGVRREAGAVEVIWTRDGIEQRSGADWLLWASPILACARVFNDPDEHERQWFGGQRSVTFVTTPYQDRSVPGYTADGALFGYFQDHMNLASSGAWLADRHDGALWPGAAPSDGLERRVAFQLSAKPSTDPDASADRMLEGLEADWRARGRVDAAPLRADGRPLQCRWSFFPHFEAPAIRAGLHWDILARQGSNKTAYLGSSVWFESVEHVLRYNRAVLG